MPKVVCMTVLILCLFSNSAPPQEREIAAKPHLRWAVGDSWQVRTRDALCTMIDGKDVMLPNQGRPYNISFEITGLISVPDELCYAVEVTYPRDQTGFQRKYRAYYAKNGGGLVRLEEASLRADDSVLDRYWDFPHDAELPPLGQVPELMIHMVVPLWSRPAIGLAGQDDPERARITQDLSEDSESGRVTCRLKRLNPALATVKDEREVLQVWQPGGRWWSECRVYRRGQLVREYVLQEAVPED